MDYDTALEGATKYFQELQRIIGQDDAKKIFQEIVKKHEFIGELKNG